MIFMGATSSGNCYTCDAGYELTVMKLYSADVERPRGNGAEA